MNSTAASLPLNRVRRASMTRAGYAFIAVLLVVVLEGAVRKWAVTSATLPLILVRDVLAAYVIMYAWSHGHLKRQPVATAVMLAWSCMVLAWGLLQLVGGTSSPTILLIGLRFWLFYAWFAVAAASSMNETDYRTAVRVAVGCLVLTAPRAVLQYLSPPGARINAQTDGGDETTVFTVVPGVVRTTGTFSFTLGYATFLAMVAPLVFGVVAARKRTRAQSLFALAALGGFAVCSLVSGSRAAVLFAGAILVAYFLGRLWLARGKARVRAGVTVVVGALLVAALLYAFSGAIENTSQRFEQAAADEGFWGRLLMTFIGEAHVYNNFTWLGQGLGLGSNLAGYVRTGSQAFTIAEIEAGRILLEGGLLGYAYTALKVIVILIGVGASARLAYRLQSPYPLLLWLTVSIALLTWPAIGQLSAHGLLGLILAFGLLVFRHPTTDFFPSRRPST